MANSEAPVTIQELLVSSLAQSDALAKLLIEKGIITEQEFLKKIAEERGDTAAWHHGLLGENRH